MSRECRACEGDCDRCQDHDAPVDIFDLVRADLAERQRKGAATYGVTSLYAHNGRDALWDAYEEALDLVMYLRQTLAERGP